MKRRTVTLLAVLIVICLFFCGAAAETDLISRIRNADRIPWASEDYVLVDGEMIRVRDGTVLMDAIENIASTGSYACINSSDGTWLMDRNGSIRPLEIAADAGRLYYPFGKFGLFFGSAIRDDIVYEDEVYVYDPAADTYTKLPECRIDSVYQDPDGQVYILTENCGIYKADGEQVLEEGKYSIAINCNYGSITNDHLTAYDQTGSAVILSPFTGEMEARFPGCSWVNYDENHDIYRDNTALIGPNGTSGYGAKVIGLDGAVLKELSDDHYFCNRGESNNLYGIGSLSDDGVYNVVTDRTYWYDWEYPDPVRYITCEETGEIFKGMLDENGDIREYQSLKTGKICTWEELVEDGDPIPERYEKYRPVQKRLYWPVYTEEGLQVSAPDGTILGDGCWEYFPWEPGKESIEGFHLFEDAPVCACVDKDNFVTVINTNGETVLPAEYEQIDLIDSFSDDPKANGHCLAAKKNGRYYVFNEKGEPLFSDDE